MAKKKNLMYCPDCGEQVSRNAKRCPHCGAKLKKNPILGFIGFIFKAVLVLFIVLIAIAGFMRYKDEQERKERIRQRSNENTTIAREATATPTATPTVAPDVETIAVAPLGGSIEEAPVEEAVPEASTSSSGIRPEFKKFMDDYESFYMQYYDLMDKMAAQPGDLSIIADYTKLTLDVAKWDDDLDDWDEEDMTDEELSYYLDVTNRIMQRSLQSIQAMDE